MGDGRIEPEAIPGRGLDGPVVRGVVATLRSRAIGVRQECADAGRVWSGVSGCFTGDGLEGVWSGLDRPLKWLGAVADRMDSAAGVLEKFAEAADVLSRQYESLYADAVGFRARIDPGVLLPVNETRVVGDVVIMEQVGEAPAYWKESGEALAQNSALMRRVDVLAAAVSQAEADCVNGLNALRNVCVPQATGFTAEDLDYLAQTDEMLPWGGVVYGDPNVLESLGYVPKDVLGGLRDGAGALIGRDPSTREWSRATAGQAWGNVIGTVVAIPVAMFAQPFVSSETRAGKSDGVLGWAYGKVNAAGDAIFDRDMWGKDPARAFGNTAVNVATLFVGGGEIAGGVKVGLKALSGTAKTARAAEILAKAAVVAGKAEDLFKLPGKLAGKGLDMLASRFKNVDLGDLGRAGEDVAGRRASELTPGHELDPAVGAGSSVKRSGDTRPSDGHGMAPGEVHETARGWPLSAPTPEQVRQLDMLVAEPNSPVVKIGDRYFLKDPIEVQFDPDKFFKNAGIDPDSVYKDGVTWRQEYARQLKLQQDGLNDLSVGEWQFNRDDFAANGRVDVSSAPRGSNTDRTAVLHGPDEVAGGRIDAWDGVGSSRVNSSIGSQWKDQIDGLQGDVQDALLGVGLDPTSELARFINMNVTLVP